MFATHSPWLSASGWGLLVLATAGMPQIAHAQSLEPSPSHAAAAPKPWENPDTSSAKAMKRVADKAAKSSEPAKPSKSSAKSADAAKPADAKAGDTAKTSDTTKAVDAKDTKKTSPAPAATAANPAAPSAGLTKQPAKPVAAPTTAAEVPAPASGKPAAAAAPAVVAPVIPPAPPVATAAPVPTPATAPQPSTVATSPTTPSAPAATTPPPAAATATLATPAPAAPPAQWNPIETGSIATPTSTTAASDTTQYSDWILECFGAASKKCGLRQTVTDSRGRRIVQLTARHSGKTPYLEVIVPVGISIPFGIELQLADDAKVVPRLADCDAKGCRAVTALDEHVLASLRSAKGLAVVFQDAKSGKVLKVTGSIAGFTDGVGKVTAGL